MASAADEVTAEENSKFNKPYTWFIIICIIVSIAFATCGIMLRIHFTKTKQRKSRGVITNLFMDEYIPPQAAPKFTVPTKAIV
jgi:flagellar basal body-associated protein FliL